MRKMQWIQELEREIENYDIITFDIFDTLLKRDCSSPRVVFELVENKANDLLGYKSDFSRKRFQAELDLYQKKGILTPSLEEIYNNLEIDNTAKELCFHLEEETEIILACANKPMYDIYLKCLNKGKKIYAISDMYLSNITICKILQKCGYDIKDVFISSELRANKTSGKLFDKFLERTNIGCDNILHIGDNYKADILGAKKNNINAFHIPNYIENTYYFEKKRPKTFWDKNVLYPFINNHLPFIESRISQIGYETLGPMIYGYCQWVHQMQKKHNFNKLLFCARDVCQTLSIYRKLYPEEYLNTKYLCISLQSLKKPFAAACGEDNSEEAKEQLLLIKEYLKELGCNGKVAMVDSGYGGHTQHMLQTILGTSCELHGLYMRMSKNFTQRAQNEEAFAYMFKETPSAKSYIGGAFLETMLGATHGRTQGYKRNSAGEVVPIFGISNPQALLIEEFQGGIDFFVEQWHSLNHGIHEIESDSIQNSFLKFTFYPLKADVKLMLRITGGNETYSGIVLTDKISVLKKPVTYLEALKDTYWKGGFLCITLKHYKIFCNIYLLVDEILLHFTGF